MEASIPHNHPSTPIGAAFSRASSQTVEDAARDDKDNGGVPPSRATPTLQHSDSGPPCATQASALANAVAEHPAVTPERRAPTVERHVDNISEE
ncbi:hypothetical protein VTO73DRAFT_6164 [Trametes versicolor]